MCALEVITTLRVHDEPPPYTANNGGSSREILAAVTVLPISMLRLSILVRATKRCWRSYNCDWCLDSGCNSVVTIVSTKIHPKPQEYHKNFTRDLIEYIPSLYIFCILVHKQYQYQSVAVICSSCRDWAALILSHEFAYVTSGISVHPSVNGIERDDQDPHDSIQLQKGTNNIEQNIPGDELEESTLPAATF